MTEQNIKINHLIKKYNDVNGQIKELKEQLDVIKSDVSIEMRANEIEKYNNDEYTLTYTKISSKRFDSKTFKESVSEEEYNKFVKKSEYNKISITKNKSEK